MFLNFGKIKAIIIGHGRIFNIIDDNFLLKITNGETVVDSKKSVENV